MGKKSVFLKSIIFGLVGVGTGYLFCSRLQAAPPLFCWSVGDEANSCELVRTETSRAVMSQQHKQSEAQYTPQRIWFSLIVSDISLPILSAISLSKSPKSMHYARIHIQKQLFKELLWQDRVKCRPEVQFGECRMSQWGRVQVASSVDQFALYANVMTQCDPEQAAQSISCLWGLRFWGSSRLWRLGLASWAMLLWWHFRNEWALWLRGVKYVSEAVVH